jgi:hypothetical protein
LFFFFLFYFFKKKNEKRKNKTEIMVAGFREYRARFRPDWPESGWIPDRIRPECWITCHLAGILDGSNRSGRIYGRLAGVLVGSDCSGQISGQSGWDPPRTTGSRPVGRKLAGIRPFCAGFRQRSPKSSKNGQIPQFLPEFVSAEYKKIFL